MNKVIDYPFWIAAGIFFGYASFYMFEQGEYLLAITQLMTSVIAVAIILLHIADDWT